MRRIVSIVLVVLVIGLILPGCSQGQINELKGQIVEKDAQIAALNSTVKARDATIDDLGEKNAELQKEIDKYKNIALEVRRAEIEISFYPDVPQCKDGFMYWRVIIRETNGVGITVKKIIKYHRSWKGGQAEICIYESSEVSFLPLYIPPYKERSLTAGYADCSLKDKETHYTYIIFCEDDNHNEIVTMGTLIVNKGNR